MAAAFVAAVTIFLFLTVTIARSNRCLGEKGRRRSMRNDEDQEKQVLRNGDFEDEQPEWSERSLTGWCGGRA